jgi:expansin (peptidoglycan-binding protein)
VVGVSAVRTPSRSLIVGLATVVGIAVIAVVLFVFASTSSMPASITYNGHSYGAMVAVTPIEVQAHIGALSPAHVTIDGKPAYVSSGNPPRIVALPIAHGGYDAYQLTS